MTGTFVSIDGLTYTVNVGSQEGTLILGEDPVHITWSRGDHIFVSLRTRECNIRVKTSVDLSFLYTDSPTGCPVTIYQGETCIFYGFLTPQVWDAPFRGIYDEVELVATDALAALKQLKYTEVQDWAQTLLTTQAIVNRACALIGLTGIPTMRSDAASTALVNEATFLPQYHDVSELSDERTSWAEVLQAVATYEGYLFMQSDTDALTLSAIDVIDRVSNDTPASIVMHNEDSASADIRMSIDPARSKVKVEYADLSPIDLTPEITDDRLDDTLLAETIVATSGNAEETDTCYFESKDWAPTDARTGCGAVVRTTDSDSVQTEVTPCIVGPATMKVAVINTQDVDNLFYAPLKMSITAWARNDMETDANGYHKLTVASKSSNFNPVLTLHFYDPVSGSSYDYERGLSVKDKDGFTTVDFLVYPRNNAAEAVYTGYFRLVIPSGCVISNITTVMANAAHDPTTRKKVILDTVENDGIIELTASGWNDSITIDARLRAAINGYSPADVVNDKTWDKYPYCETSQFSVPRKRFKATLVGKYAPMALLSDSNVSTQKLIAEGGDIDLKMNRTTLDMIETWVAVS